MTDRYLWAIVYDVHVEPFDKTRDDFTPYWEFGYDTKHLLSGTYVEDALRDLLACPSLRLGEPYEQCRSEYSESVSCVRTKIRVAKIERLMRVDHAPANRADQR